MTRPCLAALLTLLGGCRIASFTPPSGDDAGPGAASPREFFDEQVQPLVDAQCAGSTCHGDAAEGPMFAADGSDYDRVLATARIDGTGLIVVPGMPDASAFFDLPSIMNHPLSNWSDNGPVRAWILMEGNVELVDAGPMMQPPVVFPPLAPDDNAMETILLEVEGTVLGELRFTARINSGMLTLEEVELHARATDVSITEPRVYVIDGSDRRLAHEFTESANYTATPSTPVVLASTAALGDFPTGSSIELEVGTISAL